MLSNHFSHFWRFVVYAFPREIFRRQPEHNHNASFFFRPEPISHGLDIWIFPWELIKRKIPVHNWLRSVAGTTRNGDKSRPLDVQGPGSPCPSRSGASNCLGMLRVYAGIIFQKLVYFLFSRVYQFWTHLFLETWWCFDSSLTTISTRNNYHFDERAFHNSLVPSHHPWHRAARFCHVTNLFSWHIWGWNHDAGADYADVQRVKRQLCLENDLHIDNAFCVDKAPLFSQFDESTQLIDWLVHIATLCLKNPCPLWNLSTHSLTETWLPENRSTFRQLCITLWLHHAHPFVAAAGKSLSHRDKQSVWSQSCFVQDSWQCSDCALSCAIWLLQTNEQLSRLSFYQQWVGSGAASLLAADVREMWHPAQKRFARQVCLRNPFPPFPLGISIIHSLPEAGSWERQYAPPALHYGCIMPIPSLQLHERPVS